jgi:hypothetical protein
MKNVWLHYLKQPNKKIIFFSSLIVLVITLTLFVDFLTYIEKRDGFVFNDPFLKLVAPIQLSGFIFILTYFLGIVGVFFSIRNPILFICLIQAYTILTVFRIMSIYLVPLDPPLSLIPLKDSFLEMFFYSGRQNLKDLFFSGHTATIFLFAFGFKKKYQRLFFFLGASLVGVLVLLQHIHYSIDVLAAPFFAYGAIFLQNKINIT